jgi:hypothetical protein
MPRQCIPAATRRIGTLAGVVLAMRPAVFAAAQQSVALSVDDPRPVSAAVVLIEQHCHCIITYEDPKWQRDQVIDISGSVRHRADVRTQIPRGGRFTFSVNDGLNSPQQVRTVLGTVLAESESSNAPGNFQVRTGAAAFHVVPQSGSILDAPVKTAQGSQPLGDVVSAIVRLAGQVTGQTIELATGPINLLQMPIVVEAHQESANDALERAFGSSGRKVSWQLFYDVGTQRYYLNMHIVQ